MHDLSESSSILRINNSPNYRDGQMGGPRLRVSRILAASSRNLLKSTMASFLREIKRNRSFTEEKDEFLTREISKQTAFLKTMNADRRPRGNQGTFPQVRPYATTASSRRFLAFSFRQTVGRTRTGTDGLCMWGERVIGRARRICKVWQCLGFSHN